MPKLAIDGAEIEVEAGMTVLQACEAAGKEIPRFCYHERLSIAGNCRMCLVEMERSPKPVASCAMPAGDGMVIRTDTEYVRKAREGVMEFLLINHPLDCPICDQGGECDLQDQAMGYGDDRTRYTENKRAVKDKNLGPLIKTVMTRCIHCTRCVRFATEIAGVPELGATGRGESMEIGAYVERALTSELSGNMIDLCPVGALTSKPYAFHARPWELRKTESVDAMDAVGSNIRVDVRGAEVMRVLPRLHEDVNEEWISDKTRFACDGLRRQRLDRPYVRGADGKLAPANWAEAFDAAAKRLGDDPSRIAALLGDQVDVETAYALKSLLDGLGVQNRDCRQDGAKIDASVRGAYLFNSAIAGIDQADALLIVGADPRWEAPVLNARIRQRVLYGGLKVGVIGVDRDLTYRHVHLGAGPQSLSEALDGKGDFAQVLAAAERPMLILGQAALTRGDGAQVLYAARAVAEKYGMIRDGEGDAPAWNGFNMLHSAAGRVGALDVGFLPGEGGRDRDGILAGAEAGEIATVYLLAADEIPMDRLGKAFVIYQGHHGDAGAHRADVVLPGAAYTEKDALWVNTEGRVQIGAAATKPPGEAREDWKILRALSAVLNKTLPFDNQEQLRHALMEAHPVLAGIDQACAGDWGAFGTEGAMGAAPFVPAIENFYMTDPICRASETMAQCAAAYLGSGARTGADG